MGKGLPKPPDDRRCTATTKKGTRCTSWSITGEQTCATHSTDRASLIVTDPVAAAQQSQEAKRRKKELADREERMRSAGLREQVRLRLEAHASEVVDALLHGLRHPDPTIRLKYIDQWYSRSYGAIVRPNLNLNAGVVNQAQALEIKEAMAGLSPQDRMAAAREALGLPRKTEDVIDVEAKEV